jgi:hypothetical protein
MSTAELFAAAFHIGDRNSLNGVPFDSHVRNAGNVLDQKPFGLAFDDDPASVLQHQPAVHDAGMIGLCLIGIDRTEALTRRARHDAIEPARDAGELTNVSAGDFVLSLNDTETLRSECTVQKTDAGKE